jgi:phosphoribosylformylglycinamidine synthase subunit PurL
MTTIYPDVSQLIKEPILTESTIEQEQLLKSHKLTENEFLTIKNHLQRLPTYAELGVLSAMWSEHCSYKSSKFWLKQLPTTGQDVIYGPGENAGVVRLEDDLCVVFKMESHNHPSFIAPFHGAATGVGGIMRDVFCMGARPLANIDCLRFGHKSSEHSKWLVSEVVRGIAHYSNCVGVATVGGNISFDKSYAGNCLVNVMCLGLAKEKEIFTGKATGIGNQVIYVGAATGRDGIHGATMASDVFAEDTSSNKGVIQVGDPFYEKLLIEATLEILSENLVVGLQDMGAAGLSSSLFEMASRGKVGVYLDLDKVPTRALDMSPYEMLLSESQERMLFVAEPKNIDKIKTICKKWQLDFASIGVLTQTQKVQATYKNKLHLDLDVDLAVDLAPQYQRPFSPRNKSLLKVDIRESCKNIIASQGIQDVCCKLAKLKPHCEDIYRQYDQEIGTRTVLGPESGGAAVLWAHTQQNPDTKLGVAIASSCLETYVSIDPKMGTIHSVYKAARMICAAGGKPLALTNCLNFADPNDPHVMWDFKESIQGIKWACEKLNIPVVSGNVSLYNETDGKSILPTPMIAIVGKVKDINKTTPARTTIESSIYLLSAKKYSAHFNGSLFAKAYDIPKGTTLHNLCPETEQETYNILEQLNYHKILHSARDIGEGGMLMTIIKILPVHKLSAQIKLTDDIKDLYETLFAETPSAYIICIDKKREEEFKKISLKHTYTKISKIGSTYKAQNNPEIKINESRIDLTKITTALTGAINNA